MRGRSSLVAVVLGISAFLAHTNPRTSPRNAAAKESASTTLDSADQQTVSDWDLLRNFEDFYHLGATAPKNDKAGGKVRFRNRDGSILDATFTTGAEAKRTDQKWQMLRDKFDWMLATVPDPELSGMRLSFDREINSIQNAVESGGYHFDRFFFPWHAPGQASHSAETSKEAIEAHHNLPGMLLFRSGERHKRDLVVFLVGETPTSGIVPKQFANAIRFGRLSTTPDKISIAGPGFSGSFDSLERISRDQNLCRLKLRTWTSSSSSQSAFEDSRDGRDDLKAVMESTAYRIEAFITYLRTEWHESGPIVLLVEEGTAFGAGIRDSIRESLQGAKAKQVQIKPVYIVQFPRGIGKLRNATDGKDALSNPDTLKGAEMTHRGLPLTLKEERSGSSEMPQFSLEQSPVSQESVLLAIGSLIKKSSLHYAGIVATDPLDLVFLSRFLRSASPNARLFTFDPDNLYEHGSDAAEFQGMLTVTNYPLIPFNQLWTRSAFDSTMLIFGSGESEAAYNAVVDLLPDPDVDSTPGGTKEHRLREYADPFHDDFDTQKNGKPALWITVAGGNGYAPVTRLPSAQRPASGLHGKPGGSEFFAVMDTDAKARQSLHDTARWIPEYWESWGYIFIAIAILSVAYAVVICISRPDGNRILATFSVKRDEDSPDARAHFLFLIGLALLGLVALWLAVPYIVLLQNASFWSAHSAGHWRIGALLVLVAGSASAVSFRLLEGQQRRAESTITPWAGVLYTALAAVSLCVYLDSQYGVSLFQSQGSVLSPFGLALVPAAAAPATIAFERHIQFERLEQAVLKVFLFVFGLANVVLIVEVSQPPFVGVSPSLCRLWRLFYAGSAVMGMLIITQAMPLAEALRSLRRNAKRGSKSALFSQLYIWLTALFAVGAGTLFIWAFAHVSEQSLVPQHFLAACRALNLTSGVSPLTTLTLTVFALLCWSFLELRRLTFHEDRRPQVPNLPKTDVFCPHLKDLVQCINNRIGREFFHPVYNLILGLGIFACILFVSFSGHQTIEDQWLNGLMLSFCFLVSLSLIAVANRFVLIWLAFNEFLMALERHPIREVFNYLPRDSVWAPLWQSGAKKRTHVSLTRSIECLLALKNNAKTPPLLRKGVSMILPVLSELTRDVLRRSAMRERVPAPLYHKTQKLLGEVGEMVAVELEEEKWPHGSYETRLEMSHDDSMREALRISASEFKEGEPYAISSELLALRIVPFINYVLLQLQNLALYLSIGFILLVVAMNSYSFRSQTVIDWLLVALFLVLGGLVASVFAQLDRDAVFSRITRTEAGKLDRNFFVHMLSYGVVPTVALLASHVPSVATFFFSWVKPAMDAIH